MDDPSLLEVDEDDWPQMQPESEAAERTKDSGSSRVDADSTPLRPLGLDVEAPSRSGRHTGRLAQQSPRRVTQQLGSEPSQSERLVGSASGPLQPRHRNTGVKRPVAEAVLDSTIAVVAHAKGQRAGPEGRGPENTVPLPASQNRALATQERTEVLAKRPALPYFVLKKIPIIVIALNSWYLYRRKTRG